MFKIAAPAVALLLLTACTPGAPGGGDAGPSRVEVTGAWCRPTPAGAPVGACYLTLKASVDDRFVAFTTPAARHPEIHTMSMDGGVMRMRPLPEGLDLPAGSAVALAPGGEHLMLIGLTAPLVKGDMVNLALTFETAPPVAVEAAVRQPSGGGAAAVPGQGRS
jgi:periplasmic copper chaperone A